MKMTPYSGSNDVEWFHAMDTSMRWQGDKKRKKAGIYVAKTLKRLEEKIQGRVLSHLLYLMRIAEKTVQKRVALALANLCSAEDQRTIFIDNNGLELLLGLLGSTNLKQQLDGSIALYKLANKATTLSPIDAAPPSPTPQVYLGEQYVNNPTLSDVTFLVEGKRFYAHRICLLASSDAFRAMFDGGYREKDARDIEIPNIRWEVFELMMRFIYTGSVDITLDIAQDLLRAADQYLLEGLKRLCEYTIAQDISLENVSSMYELSEAFHAISLRHTCILFILEQFEKLSARPGYSHLIQLTIPEIRNYFIKALTRPNSDNRGCRQLLRDHQSLSSDARVLLFVNASPVGSKLMRLADGPLLFSISTKKVRDLMFPNSPVSAYLSPILSPDIFMLVFQNAQVNESCEKYVVQESHDSTARNHGC
ncbi:hypothetical protein TEA_001927 [Camellia sinensis var. sinensis]|uniref:BTB domain-containing protein n=1 Tax=Camellia sinensis var. sinensis TaxID=542762 RepID=A0A4V3WJI3_CAMSN|nr:hypothetical protein TEA_001927 [Camellia sinensis var. sinensis]